MLTEKRGRVFMIVGPTCVGKNTLISEVRKRGEFGVTVSCTTRQPRKGEVDGEHYHFITREEFILRVNRGEFAEYAEVHGNLYGTLLSNLESLTESGRNVIFDIDIQGAKQLKAKFPDFQMVFIAPPSLEELRRRLAERNSGESPEEVEVRFKSAIVELRQAGEADWLIKNANLNQAVSFLYQLIEDLTEGRNISTLRYCNPTLVNMCRQAASPVV